MGAGSFLVALQEVVMIPGGIATQLMSQFPRRVLTSS